MHILPQLILGLILSGLISYGGYRKQALSETGVVGALLIGATTFGFGGWIWGMLLITFFVLSSALSYYKKAAKKELSEKFAKGARRDLGQTLANGGAGMLIALGSLFSGNATLLAAFTGAMATVNADTWATELGVLSKQPPRLITNGKTVEPGTSGGISLLGTFATFLGGLVIGIAGILFLLIDKTIGGYATAQNGINTAGELLALLPAAALGGLAGSLCDSLLGATVQAIYYSTQREKETERDTEPDGTPNHHLRGWRWLNNDWVNFLSSLVGALVAALAWKFLAA